MDENKEKETESTHKYRSNEPYEPMEETSFDL